VRTAEQVIAREPILTLVVGVLGVMFLLWPLVAFIGYLVAGIWVGEWVLRRVQPSVIRTRPYLAATIGVLLLQLVSTVPVLGLLAALASLFGFGAVLLLAWRTLTARPSGAVAQGVMASPVAG